MTEETQDRLDFDALFHLDASPPETPVKLPKSKRGLLRKAAGYRASPGLLNAVRVALELRQPLLLTGEPGTGKTRLADFVAERIGVRKPLPFRVKSTSTSRDLMYTYDAIGRFNSDADAEQIVDFVDYGALGKAILFANRKDDVVKFIGRNVNHPGSPSLSLVLIDEIDKAPRDFPNDFLGELDEMRFTVPEIDTNVEVRAPDELLPVVVITSNSEKDLPEAFLRRCVYYHIEFPEKEDLKDILRSRLDGLVDISDSFLDGAIDMLYEVRKHRDSMQKVPGTSEFIEWLLALHRLRHDLSGIFDANADAVYMTQGVLFKTHRDLTVGSSVLDELGKA